MRVGRHAALCAEHKIITRYNDITLLQKSWKWFMSFRAMRREKSLFIFFFSFFLLALVRTPLLCASVWIAPLCESIWVGRRSRHSYLWHNSRYKFQFTFAFCFDVPIPFCVSHTDIINEISLCDTSRATDARGGSERQQKGRHHPSRDNCFIIMIVMKTFLFHIFFLLHLFTWSRGQDSCPN